MTKHIDKPNAIKLQIMFIQTSSVYMYECMGYSISPSQALSRRKP